MDRKTKRFNLRGFKMNKIENKEIRASLIKNFELLEEKLNQNNKKISELEIELKRGKEQREKREDIENYSHPEAIFGFSKE